MRPDLFFLFHTFFKIGATSFGGHAALVSVLQKEFVEKKGIITEEDILDGLSIASFLPGPLAVNVVTLVGYKLRGWVGAIISMTAVLLPPFVLMIIIAELYARYSDLGPVEGFLKGVAPVIIALILSMCHKMFINNMSKPWQYTLLLLVLLSSFFFNGYLWIVLYITVGGAIGYFFTSKKRINVNENLDGPVNTNWPQLFSGIVIIVVGFTFLFVFLEGTLHQLLYEFTRISLTLFGGGYVMVPILHDIVVDSLGWLSTDEFTNAIAFGQMTPGPILVSATYIGYKMGGTIGALLATVGIFLPSAALMVCVGNVFESIKESPVFDGILMGVRAVIIALIAFSAWTLFSPLEQKLFSGVMAAMSWYLITYKKVNYLLVILVAGVVGLLFL